MTKPSIQKQWNVSQIPNLAGLTAIVTGSNSGLGFETAKALFANDAEVIIACRNTQKGTEALQQITAAHPNKNSSKIRVMQLDLANLQSVKTFAKEVAASHSKIDLLVNNAGVMIPPKSFTNDGFESQFGTNHLGHFALTGLLLPLLEKSDYARIVVVSSLANRFGKIRFKNLNAEKFYIKWDAYGQSKLANIVFANELQKRLKAKGSHIKVATVHPGFSSTNLQRYLPGASLINPLFSQSQDMGALPSLFAATHSDIMGGEYIGPSKLFETRGYPAPAKTPRTAKNAKTASQLWDKSVEFTGINYLN